jgi:fructose-1,6-bisphosphatase I
MQFSQDGNIYSINEEIMFTFHKELKTIKYCQSEEEDRPYTSRYIGSLVSDIHRNMIKGGIYIYPTSSKSPKGN